MLRLLFFGITSLIILSVNGERKEDVRKIHLEGLGNVIGEKYWDGEYYEFYGVPYATIPKGRDRYKAPLPPTPWEEDMIAKRGLLICQQVYYSEQDEEDDLYGIEECLVSSLMVPKIASETNLVPIVIYIHSGGFAGGSGNMAKFYHLARQDVLVVNFNYRVGALGFACLGTEDIPGNAALKDIVAAIKFIKKYAKNFGGDPDNITIAGYSVGAALAEIVALSKETRGLFKKLALDSGSAITPFAVNRHPIDTATNIVRAIGYKGKTVEDLNEFLLEVDIKDLLSHSRNFFLKNSTFGFAPCIENPSNPGAVLTESPLDTLKKGNYGDFALLTGFANMEGISRSSMFEEWRGLMNQKLEDFLPADLVFNNDKERDEFIQEVKQFYFNNKLVTLDTVQEFIDYFSDSMFKYAIMKSAKLHAENLKKPIFMYEFTYVGKLNTKHSYMDRISGASHRDASAYVLDFYDWTRNFTDMDMKDRITFMWGDFIKFENPTPYESALLTVKWLKYTNKNPNYLDIGYNLEMKKDLFSKGYQFWDKVYKTHYWTPTVVNPDAYKRKPKTKNTDEKEAVNKSVDDNKVTPESVGKPTPNADKKLSPVNPSGTDKSVPETKVKETQQKPTESKPTPKNTEKPASAAETKETKQKPVQSKSDSKNSETPTAAKVKAPERKPAETKPNSKSTGKPASADAKEANQKPVETKPNSKNSETLTEAK